MLAKKPVASTALPVRSSNPVGTLSPQRRHKRVSQQEANARGEKLGLSDDELAFYEALETNDSAVQVLGDKTLRGIARELVETIRGNVTIDRMLRESVRANLRRLVKRILRRHGYPPDKQEKATRTVFEQAEVLSAAWGREFPFGRDATTDAAHCV